jgi:tetratricopeptide (TPR) repeat protein
MEKGKAAGAFKDEKQYTNLAKLYLMTGQQSGDQKGPATKAVATLEEGMSKGVVTSSADNYTLLGTAAYMAEDNSKALASYQKAIPLAKDGEANIRAGQLLLESNKFTEAKSLIQQGIDKGVQHKGTAYMLLAEANRGLKDKPGTIAAMEKAAQDPETSTKAKAWLKAQGASK